jgi:chaperonin cofactor prefoldin
MARTPQSVELLTISEIQAIKTQLQETTKLLEDAEKLAKEKQIDGLNVLYKSGLLRVEASLRRLHSSLYQSISQTRLGQKV